MLQINHKFLVGSGFNSSLMAQRSRVGQGLWSHHDFMSVHVSLTASISNSAPQGEVKPTGWVPSHTTNSFPANTGLGACKNCHTIPCGLYRSASEKLWLRKGAGEKNSCFQQVIELLRHTALLQHAGIFSSPAKLSPGWVLCYSWVQEQSLAQRKGLICSKTFQLFRGEGEGVKQWTKQLSLKSK